MVTGELPTKAESGTIPLTQDVNLHFNKVLSVKKYWNPDLPELMTGVCVYVCAPACVSTCVHVYAHMCAL